MLAAIAETAQPELHPGQLADVGQAIQAHTRQFARRQEIWFRGLKELERFELTPETSLDALADRIAGWYKLGYN